MKKKAGWFERYLGRRNAPDSAPVLIEDEQETLSGRRHSQRVPAPVGLFYFVPPDRFVTLELRLEISEDGERREIPCFLFDVNQSGLAFACSEALESGATVHIEGHLAQDLEPLVDCDIEIVDRRPFPMERPHPPGFDPAGLFVHGGNMSISAAMALLRATLDCMAIQMHLPEVAGEIGTQAADDAPSGGAEKSLPSGTRTSEATEISFGALPVLDVEVIEEELRRNSERVALTMPLAYIAEDESCHYVELHIGRPDKGIETSTIGHLMDYSDDGARIESVRKFDVGEKIKVMGQSVETGAVLFEDVFVIMNRRKQPRSHGSQKTEHVEFTFGATVSDSLEQSEDLVYNYGLKINKDASRLLYKSIMDSVLVANLNEGRDTPVRSLSEVNGD